MRAMLLPCLLLLQWSLVEAQDTYAVDTFSQIRTTGALEVELVESDRHEVVVEPTDQEEIDLTVKHGELRLQNIKITGAKRTVRVTVYYRSLDRILAMAGSRITGQDTLRAERMAIKVSSGARVELPIAVDALRGTTSEGGHLYLSGSAATQEIKSSTGGQYYANDLTCQHTYVRATTGAQVRVLAHDFLDARASLGGTINYGGEPSRRHIQTNLTGTVRRY